jgi:hypothetical protein
VKAFSYRRVKNDQRDAADLSTPVPIRHFDL